ncbi:hypothetical protein Tco_1322928 [Tanacetum coccineum]
MDRSYEIIATKQSEKYKCKNIFPTSSNIAIHASELCGGEGDDKEFVVMGESREDLLEKDMIVMRRSKEFRREEVVMCEEDEIAVTGVDRDRNVEKEETRRISRLLLLAVGRKVVAFPIFQESHILTKEEMHAMGPGISSVEDEMRDVEGCGGSNAEEHIGFTSRQ